MTFRVMAARDVRHALRKWSRHLEADVVRRFGFEFCNDLFARHFGGGAPKAPPPPPPPPQKSDAEIQAEKAKAKKLIASRKGRGASILAGDAGFLQPQDEGGKVTLG